MEGLESPPENAEALMHFDAESDGGNPSVDYLHPKVYFFTEELSLRSKTFPQEWYDAMSREIREELQPKEPPFFTVRVNRLTIMFSLISLTTARLEKCF